MIIDTNILLDLLVRDGQRGVDELFDSANKIVITDTILAEAVYVMIGPQFNFARDDVVSALCAVLKKSNVKHSSHVGESYLQLYARTNLDLADCYLIALAVKTKQPLKTFDRAMQRAYLKQLNAK